MGTWDNADGLHVRFGNDETVARTGGEKMKPFDGERQWVFDLTATDITDTTAVIMQEVLLPDNLFIDQARFDVTTAFDSASDTATLTIGLIRKDRTTALDADGIDVAILETSLAVAGDQVICDGALINTQLSNPGLLLIKYGTEAFTAGVGRLTITGHMLA